MTAPATGLAAYYSRRAAEYEEIYARPERQDELAALRAALKSEFAGRDVLELACGTGYWTAVIAATARSVQATDLGPEVLELARAKGLGPHVRFDPGDAYSPAPAPECDAGLAAFWWSHVPRARLPAFLAAFHRALAPGARVTFIDNVFVAGSSTPISRTDAAGDTWQRRRLRDGSEHEVLKNFPEASELRAAVAGSARNVQVESGRYFWRLTYWIG